MILYFYNVVFNRHRKRVWWYAVRREVLLLGICVLYIKAEYVLYLPLYVVFVPCAGRQIGWRTDEMYCPEAGGKGYGRTGKRLIYSISAARSR